MRAISSSLLILIALASGCASNVEIQTDYNRNADFSALRTFAWQDTAVASTGDYDPDVAKRIDSIIRRSVIENLTDKGFRQTGGPDPDFLVSYHVVVTEEEDPNLYEERENVFDTIDVAPGETFKIYREDLRINEGIIRKGTLILFFLEPDSKRLIWQGIAAGTAISARDALRKSERAVDAMLEQFPPGAAGQE